MLESLRLGHTQWQVQYFPDGYTSPEIGSTNIGQILSQKLHENKRNWTEKVGGRHPYLISSVYDVCLYWYGKHEGSQLSE